MKTKTRDRRATPQPARTGDAGEPAYQLWMDGRPLNMPTDYLPLRDARFVRGVTGRSVAIIDLRSHRIIDPDERHAGGPAAGRRA